VSKEEEAVAGIEELDSIDARLLLQKGERRVEEWHGFTKQVDETPSMAVAKQHPVAAAGEIAAVGISSSSIVAVAASSDVEVEEPLQRFGEILAVESIGDEVATGFGDALGSAQRLGAEAPRRRGVGPPRASSSQARPCRCLQPTEGDGGESAVFSHAHACERDI
jgi:hypothetical protein